MPTSIPVEIPQKRLVSDGVLGMIFFLAAEGMFFAGLISAFVVNRASAGVWPPYGQPKLPVEVTGVNTMILLASAITLWLFNRQVKNSTEKIKSQSLLYVTLLLGTIFLGIQGTEWVRLIQFGLTTSSSLYGSFFYLIVGAHGIHVVAGLLILFYLFSKTRGSCTLSALKNKATVCSMYWYFVVLVWPILYTLVYFA